MPRERPPPTLRPQRSSRQLPFASHSTQSKKVLLMSIQDDDKAIVGRWFTNFWGKTCDLVIW